MANAHLDHHLALLAHLRTILVALGEAEQILDDSHAMYLERYDELLADLPNDPEASLYLGQDLISQIFQRYPQIAHQLNEKARTASPAGFFLSGKSCRYKNAAQ